MVVNHREDASPEDKRDNLRTLALLRTGDYRWDRLNLALVDAASPGGELPLKGGGVGLARRIGLDLALGRLNRASGDPLLVCLDADTIVRPEYLQAITAHFCRCRAGAAAIPYRHQNGATPDADHLITRYELFLRGYILGLELAGSPYAFHSVGSAMACRASAYCAIGGMNNRQAGEDFYFMQQLSRVAGVEQLSGTVVYPSPRPSHRVPFGTGRAVQRMASDGEGELLFYREECFRTLEAWLRLVRSGTALDGAALQTAACRLSPCLAEFLAGNRFSVVWDRLRSNHPVEERLLTAFHGWFDGLKSMKLIHHLSAGPYPRCEPDAALKGLFSWRGLEPVAGATALLDTLRTLQNGPDNLPPP